jgi:hypothetical protein
MSHPIRPVWLTEPGPDRPARDQPRVLTSVSTRLEGATS